MKKLLCVALFAATLAVPARAQAQCCYGPVKINGGVKIYLKVDVGGATLPLAPWYLYFPAGAGSLSAGPHGHYPNWPAQPPAASAAFGFPPPYPPPAPLLAPPRPAPAIQRTAYQEGGFQGMPAPGYWYGQ
jgi:hypothetical protein